MLITISGSAIRQRSCENNTQFTVLFLTCFLTRIPPYYAVLI